MTVNSVTVEVYAQGLTGNHSQVVAGIPSNIVEALLSGLPAMGR